LKSYGNCRTSSATTWRQRWSARGPQASLKASARFSTQSFLLTYCDCTGWITATLLTTALGNKALLMKKRVINTYLITSSRQLTTKRTRRGTGGQQFYSGVGSLISRSSQSMSSKTCRSKLPLVEHGTSQSCMWIHKLFFRYPFVKEGQP